MRHQRQNLSCYLERLSGLQALCLYTGSLLEERGRPGDHSV